MARANAMLCLLLFQTAAAGLPPATPGGAVGPRAVGRGAKAPASMSNVAPLLSFGRRSMEAAEVEREARRLAAARSAMAAEDLADGLSPSLGSLVARAWWLSVVFAPVYGTCGLAWLVPAFRRRVWYRLLTSCLGASGACFVKWAQWSATRSDLFPDALCAELGGLQADAPRHGWSHTRCLVEAAVGCRVEDYFEAFERRPIASGSIAQVHRASRRGVDVAVKVRHPRVAFQMRVDSRLMVLGAKCVEALPGLRGLRLSDTVHQFSASLAQQSRLDREADALRRFERNFRGWHDVNFPRPLLATPGVIVESFARGTLVNGLARDAKVRGDLTPRERRNGAHLVNRGEDIYLKMLLEDKLMHADLHPGNLLLDDRGGALRINVVDAGMVAVLSDDECEAFVGLIEALGAADAAAAARCVRRFDPANDASMSDDAKRAFDADVAALFATSCRGYGTGVDFGEVVRGVLTLIRAHRVRISAVYATLIINALCLDGMAGDLLPGYSVLDGARPLLSTHRWLVSDRGAPRRTKWWRPRLGPALFRRVCLPVAWRLKKIHDARVKRGIM